MSCPYGVVGSVRKIGIIPQGAERKDICTDNATLLTGISDLTDYTKCTEALDQVWLEEFKASVTDNTTKYSEVTIISTYIDIFDDSALNDSATYSNCWAPRANLFVQFSCE